MNMFKEALSFLFSLLIIFIILAIGYGIGWMDGMSNVEDLDENLEKAEKLLNETEELLYKMEKVVCRYTA